MPIRYAGGRLDRAGSRRRDDDWVADRLADPRCRVVPLWRDRNLVYRLGGAPEPVVLVGPPSPAVRDGGANLTLLGLDGDTAVFAVDVSALDESGAASVVGGGEFVDLRYAGPLLPPSDAALLAYARGILHWHGNHRHCGRCGHPTRSEQAGHMRRCAAPACGHETFPRTDPAVIMLVEYRPVDGAPPTCLLGHHGRLPAGAYSTLAGFVEPGETLEEAVVREVQEEVGLEVREVTYVASQPWPFPASLMVGFRARARATTMTLDRDELADARWFTAAELRRFGEWGDDESAWRLPRRDSIARFLVETWLLDVDPPG